MPDALLQPPDLVGRWAFERDIDDRRAGSRLTAAGSAVFSRAGEAAIEWSEEGVLRLPSGDVAVEAHRILRLDGARSWTVDFADGRGFHPWAVGADLVHDCAPDVYRGRLDPAPSGWTMRWAASGPAKDYVIVTRYSRRSPSAPPAAVLE